MLEVGRTGREKRITPAPTPQIPTKFATVEQLGIYCEVTGRVFNMHSARQNGVLSRLLKLVGIYFGPAARRIYLENCAKDYRLEEKLDDVDGMLIQKIEEYYYRNEDQGGRQGQRADATSRKEVEEIGSLRFRALFDAARSQSLARLTSKTKV